MSPFPKKENQIKGFGNATSLAFLRKGGWSEKRFNLALHIRGQTKQEWLLHLEILCYMIYKQNPLSNKIKCFLSQGEKNQIKGFTKAKGIVRLHCTWYMYKKALRLIVPNSGHIVTSSLVTQRSWRQLFIMHQSIQLMFFTPMATRLMYKVHLGEVYNST